MLTRLEEKGYLENYELQILTKQGEVRDVEASMRIFPEHGYLEGTVIDITNRKKAEKALKTSRANLSAISENTQDFILLCDQHGNPVYFNSAYAKVMKALLGITIEPGIKPHTLLLDNKERAVWEENHRKVLSGERFTFEHSRTGKDGVPRYFES